MADLLFLFVNVYIVASFETEHETLTVADGVAATDPSAIDSVQQTKPPAPKISRRLLERKDSVDYSDRDTESPAADEAAPVVRNRPSRYSGLK